MSSKKNSDKHNQLKSFLDRKDDDDAFEKEAREGFAQFKEDDLLETQRELDGKVAEMFRKTRKQSNSFVYWVAAAALLVFTSITGYFLLEVMERPKDLAQHEAPRRVPPQTPEEKEADPGIVTTPEEVNKAPEPKRSATSATEREISAPQETEMAKSMDDVQPAATEAHSDTIVQAVSDAESEKFAMAVNTGVSSQAVRSDAVTDEKESSLPRKKAFTKEKTLRSSPAAPPPVAMEAKNERTVQNSCYYNQGESALHARVSDSLQRRAILRRFEARLFISQTGKVDSVAIENPHALNEDEKKQLKELLSTLDGFIFDNSRGKNVAAEYYLDFKP